MVVEYGLHSDWKWNEVWKVQGEKEIKVLHVIMFPGLPQHCDSCLLMHTLLRPFSLQNQSCDGNYKTVGQNVTILAPVLWNQYVFLLMSTLLLFSVITVTMTFQETLGRQMFAMIPHHTHTRTVMHVSTLEMPIQSTEHALIHDRTCTCCSAYSHIQQHSLLEISSSSCIIKLPSELGWKM